MIQFAKAVYSENSLEFSILVKMLHNIFGHNLDYVIYSCVCFAACLPATVLHDLLHAFFLLLHSLVPMLGRSFDERLNAGSILFTCVRTLITR